MPNWACSRSCPASHFPGACRTRSAQTVVRLLGDLLDRSVRDLRQAGPSDDEVPVTTDIVRRHELRLQHETRTPFTTGLPSTLGLTLANPGSHTLTHLRGVGVDTFDKLSTASHERLVERA